MSGESAHGGDVKLSGYSVVAEGPYGSMTWSVCQDLYALMPRTTRDQLLDGTVSRVINPYLEELVQRLLNQAGCEGVKPASLSTEWSFETREVSCVFGRIIWQVGEGFRDSIPEDQRDALYQLADIALHDFFGQRVFGPLITYAQRQVLG